MRRTFPLLAALALYFTAATAMAQSPTARWNKWQPAMSPDGSAYPAIQFRWRSDRPCTDIGCRLTVQIRNISHAPVQLHCSVYVDPPPLPYEDEIRPVTLDVRLKPSGKHSSKHKTGDTTKPLLVTGLSVTGVVVRPPKAE